MAVKWLSYNDKEKTTMKRQLITLLTLVLVAQAMHSFVNYASFNDAIGVYYADKGRLKMTVDYWQPYVVHQFADGHSDWFFQSFCFEDFAVDGKKLIHYVKRTDVTYAQKADWELFLNKLFVEGELLDALDRCIERNKATLGTPPFKHKVTIGIPMPIKGQRDWGTIDRRQLNFANDADRLTAIKWYIDLALATFKAHHYDNIALDGFYWIEEDMEQTKGLAAPVSQYIHSLGYRHYWSPYLRASGSNNIAGYGFDVVCTQPGGYAIKAAREIDRVEQSLSKAQRLGMGMVLEFAGNLFTEQDTYLPRVNKLVDMFEQAGVFESSAIGYYDGACVIHAAATGLYRGKRKLDEKTLKPVRQLIDRMAAHTVERWKKRFGEPSSVMPPKTPEPKNTGQQSAPGTKTDDWRDPEYWHF